MIENIWGIHEKSNDVQPPFNDVTRLDREPRFNVCFKLQHFQETIYLNCGMRTRCCRLSSPLCGAAGGENHSNKLSLLCWCFLLVMIAPIDPTKNPARVFFFIECPKLLLLLLLFTKWGEKTAENSPTKSRRSHCLTSALPSGGLGRPLPVWTVNTASVDSEHFSPS